MVGSLGCAARRLLMFFISEQCISLSFSPGLYCDSGFPNPVSFQQFDDLLVRHSNLGIRHGDRPISSRPTIDQQCASMFRFVHQGLLLSQQSTNLAVSPHRLLLHLRHSHIFVRRISTFYPFLNGLWPWTLCFICTR
jgi:hypothetical protein